MCIGTAMEIRVAVCTHITTASVILVREQLNIWRLVNVTHAERRIIQKSLYISCAHLSNLLTNPLLIVTHLFL